MDDIFEMTDEMLAHIIKAAETAAREELAEKARRWVIDNTDLATSVTLCWMCDSDPHELLAILDTKGE